MAITQLSTLGNTQLCQLTDTTVYGVTGDGKDYANISSSNIAFNGTNLISNIVGLMNNYIEGTGLSTGSRREVGDIILSTYWKLTVAYHVQYESGHNHSAVPTYISIVNDKIVIRPLVDWGAQVEVLVELKYYSEDSDNWWHAYPTWSTGYFRVATGSTERYREVGSWSGNVWIGEEQPKEVSVLAYTEDSEYGSVGIHVHDYLNKLGTGIDNEWHLISYVSNTSASPYPSHRRSIYSALLQDDPTPPDPPTPESYNFSPVSYFKGNKTFFQMSMIKESFTHGGEPLNSVQSTAFVRLLAHDDLESLTHGLATGTERIFSYTDNDNYVGIVRDSVDSYNDTTTYTINFYTDGVFTNFVTYLCNNSNKYHFSFLIDKGHEVARPSIIREYPSPTNPSLSLFDLNKESDIYITDEHMAEWYTWLSTSTDTEIPDPYSFGGDSETTPSTSGNYDRGSDNVGVPSLPSFNASSLGFFRAYIGNAENYDTISDLSDYLWSNGFDLDTFKKLLANPIQAILSIHLIPLAVTSTELGHSVHLGNVDTGLNMQPVASQFIELDCGTLKVSEYFGSYLDYSPYTRLSLFLPFIGVVPLGIDEIMGKTIGVKYHIDVYTGACVAFVTADGKVLYHFSGMCAINVPITSADASNIASSIISIGSTVATVVATVATGGATAPLIVPAVANTASNVLAGKANIQRSGSLSSNIGFMDNPTPYLILEVPEQCHPEDLNKFKGYPTHATFTLGALKGYTEIEEVHLENMTCTAREAQEIETLLKGGVIL